MRCGFPGFVLCSVLLLAALLPWGAAGRLYAKAPYGQQPRGLVDVWGNYGGRRGIVERDSRATTEEPGNYHSRRGVGQGETLEGGTPATTEEPAGGNTFIAERAAVGDTLLTGGMDGEWSVVPSKHEEDKKKKLKKAAEANALVATTMTLGGPCQRYVLHLVKKHGKWLPHFLESIRLLKRAQVKELTDLGRANKNNHKLLYSEVSEWKGKNQKIPKSWVSAAFVLELVKYYEDNQGTYHDPERKIKGTIPASGFVADAVAQAAGFDTDAFFAMWGLDPDKPAGNFIAERWNKHGINMPQGRTIGQHFQDIVTLRDKAIPKVEKKMKEDGRTAVTGARVYFFADTGKVNDVVLDVSK